MDQRAHPLRSVWRGIRVAQTVLVGALILSYVSLTTRADARPAWLPRTVARWHRRLCRALDVRVEVEGRLAPRCLLVSNHISWLDVAVLGAQGNLGFLSKSEVRRWPLAGWMAATAGTLFIERGGNQTGALAQRIAADIAAGRSLAIFPEATTSTGLGVRRFHPRLFAIAQQPDLGLQPVALAYRCGDAPGPDPSIPFIGEQTLMANLWVLLRHPGPVARVQLLAPLCPRPGEDRRALCARSRSAIAAALGLPEAAGLDDPPARRRARRRPAGDARD